MKYECFTREEFRSRIQPGFRYEPAHAQAQFLSTLGTIAAIASAATSIAGSAYAASQGTPSAPNPYSSSRKVAQAQANALAKQRQLSASEQMGGKASQRIPKHKEQ